MPINLRETKETPVLGTDDEKVIEAITKNQDKPEINEKENDENKIGKIIKDNLRPPAGYKVATELYVQTEEIYERGSKQSKSTWKLYVAKPEFKAIEDIIFDENGFVNPKRANDFSVGKASKEDIGKIANMPPKFRKKVEKSLFGRIDKPKGYESKDLYQLLIDSSCIYKSHSRIVDLNCVKKIDFYELVDNIVSWNCDKDERVKLFLKKDLLRGINPRLNPVSICGKPPQVGMGEFYLRHCLMLGTKVTKKSFLGYATSPLDVYPGVIDGQDLTACVEQIESSDYSDIFGHLYTIVVQGVDFVSSGATRFQIQSASPLTLLFNIENAKKPESDFNFMINKIAANKPAFLQRVSNILYEPELKKLTPSTDDFQEWDEWGRFFRGIEELAMPKLRKWFKNEKIWHWAIDPIESYSKEAKDIISSLEDGNLKYAFSEHIKPPFCKLKGSALRVVLAEILDEVLLSDTLDVDKDILGPANEYVFEFVNQNLNSIINITETWDKQIDATMWNVFHNVFPEYVQCIVSSINFYKECWPHCGGTEVPIEAISEYYIGPKNYEYLSSATKNFKKGGGKVSFPRYNEYFKTYYGFELIKKFGDSLFVRFLR
ncbi:hypothetical protein ACFLRN_01765 [Thermoproteota archaeon]